MTPANPILAYTQTLLLLLFGRALLPPQAMAPNRVQAEIIYSMIFVTINSHDRANYQAVGQLNGDTVIWFWLGSHAEYNKLLSQL